MPEFDYQWKNLPSKYLEYNDDRVKEFLSFTGLKKEVDGFVRARYCLDAGCGSGRYTYAMKQLGAQRVDSIDVSPEAVESCKQVNPTAMVENILESDRFKGPYDGLYNFVLSWGVLHHTSDPRGAFRNVSRVTRGMLHVMLYHKEGLVKHLPLREEFKKLSTDSEKVAYCTKLASERGGDAHGWFDALNPVYNFGYDNEEIERWFVEEGFVNIKFPWGKGNKHRHININGRRKDYDPNRPV